jgi:glucosamine-6-phosphate deaminase
MISSKYNATMALSSRGLRMNLLTTIAGSMMEGFLPRGWDLPKIDALCALPSESLREPQPWWDPNFQPVPCRSLEDFDVKMGHEIALAIKRARDQKRPIAFILPVGPMGMYRWTVFFLKEWAVPCDHVHGFNMDEWSDSQGRTLPSTDPGAFQNAMESAFYGPLGSATVPESQRFSASPDCLPEYAFRIADLKNQGAELVVVFGIGRVCHIAFWEPHFAAEFNSEADWKAQTHRLGARLHPLTIEQNALTSFKSRTTLVPAFANTIGPGLFLQADRIIGGADGIFGRGMQWQGTSLRMTLRYGPDPWVPSSYMPTLPGRLFFLEEVGSTLEPEMN